MRVFECGIGGFACQRVFAIQSQSTGVLGIVFYCSTCEEEYMSDFCCPDEYVTVFFCLLSSLWKQLKSRYGGARVGYFDTFSTCMDPVFSGVEFSSGEFTRGGTIVVGFLE